MKKNHEPTIFLVAVKALVRVTLYDSFGIRPSSIYRTAGIARPCAQTGGLGASEIKSFWAKGVRVDRNSKIYI